MISYFCNIARLSLCYPLSCNDLTMILKSAEKLKDIRQLDQGKLIEELKAMAEPAFRGKQIYEWLWKKSARNFDEMTNLSFSLREKLKEKFEIRYLKQGQQQKSDDRTIKNTFILADGNLIEGVLIPTSERMTACVSSQVGCSLSCKFCATGYMERMRNLNADEIVDQVVLIDKQARDNYNIPLSNIVFMGMGEPLLNYANVMKAIHYITSEEGLHFAAKRITVSTAGIAKMIMRLGDEEVRFNLALSLHAANDTKRNEIMPINEQNSLLALQEALKYFYSKTKNPITFEYIVFDKFNDELSDAAELAEFCRHVPCKVNLIEYNPIENADYRNAREEKVNQFAEFLRKRGIITNIRRSRGKDIDAACGQLAIKQTTA